MQYKTQRPNTIIMFVVLSFSVLSIIFINIPRPLSGPIRSIDRITSTNWNSDVPLCDDANNDPQSDLILDFETCQICKSKKAFSMGMMFYMYEGAENGKCNFSYYNEVENPNWDGALTTKCSVPTSIGVLTAMDKRLNTGYDLAEIETYCSKK